MNARAFGRFVVLIMLLLGFYQSWATPALAQNVPEVEVADLTTNPSLIGKEIQVDGRVALFQFHPGRGFDEILLKQSEVVLRLPPSLRFSRAPSQYVVQARGVLSKEGNRISMDVSSLKLLADDRDRLEKGLELLPAAEMANRRAWAHWAAKRAAFYKDGALEARAKEIEGDLINIEAARPESQSPDALLALAERARKAGVPAEPTPSLWIHRALLAKAKAAKSLAEISAVAAEIERHAPKSADPASARMVDLSTLGPRYDADPEPTYAQAGTAARQALDRWLLASLREREFYAKADADPAAAFELSTQAETVLPDRPVVARSLLERGLKTAARNVGSLRQSEVTALANRFKDAGKPDEGKALLRAWLADQREKKLGKNDVTGRLALAEQYRNLVNDTTSAIALLNEAAELEPGSNEISEAFRRLGYRFDGSRWVSTQSHAEERPEGTDRAADPTDPLIGLTLEEILSQRGKPDRRSVLITQGNLLIQWGYALQRGGTEYIDFVQRPGSPAIVESRYVIR